MINNKRHGQLMDLIVTMQRKFKNFCKIITPEAVQISGELDARAEELHAAIGQMLSICAVTDESDKNKFSFGMIDIKSNPLVIPIGVIQYKIKIRPDKYPGIFMKFSDRTEYWIIGLNESGQYEPLCQMAVNKRG